MSRVYGIRVETFTPKLIETFSKELGNGDILFLYSESEAVSVSKGALFSRSVKVYGSIQTQKLNLVLPIAFPKQKQPINQLRVTPELEDLYKQYLKTLKKSK